ncbi:bifunctional DNA primase/polymerase [Virgisporangium ochraceum]|uniref:DNA primase/polymerase bifunctional N-terminal domain-containing protein n=1 Tax=Virgisporangium ochraceum TaxID=65505 RepID=A0A8J3ZQE6_9ACTN|nr:bifunctional DNA primase/polymerase [Virgisporangium ochraceum]GIJ65645.1 hypothetical protein Voc01_005620 [Virgisporangium ochraceum]
MTFLDWRDHAVGPLAPCRLCGRPALMRDADGRPCHKICAEHRHGSALTGEPGALPLPDNASAASQEVKPMDHNPLLTAALTCAARGWHVFPLRPNDKRPAFPDHAEENCAGSERRCAAAGRHVGWEERATVDPDRIRRAWTVAPYGIGVACGPSGLVVVDLDMPKPGATVPEQWRLPGINDGTDVFAEICDRAAQPIPLNTYTVTTGNGGTHLYYRHPTGEPLLRNTSGTRGNGLGWLVDTRAHGGYVVAAGSSVDGRAYTVTHDADVMALPGWLADRLRPSDPASSGRPVVVDIGTGRRAAYLQAAIDRQVEHLLAATGNRNDALYIAAQNLGQLVAGGDLDAAHVTAVLTDAAEQLGLHRDPPAGQIAKTIASGLRAGARRPRRAAA